MKKLTIILSTIVLTGCFTSKKASTETTSSTPSQADVDRVADKFPGYSVDQMSEGKSLYETHCGTCHALKKPSSETESEWRRIVPVMVKKVNKNGMVLDASKEDQILKYVVTMSKK